MKENKLKNPWKGLKGYDCFGCAPDNPLGVKMEFYEEGEEIVSYWKPDTHYQGWINTLHGGIQAVLLDEISAWCVFRKLQTTGVTSKMELRYLKPVSTLDEQLILRASIIGQKRNLIVLKASLQDASGEICTTAECTYYTFTKEKAHEEFFFTSCDIEG